MQILPFDLKVNINCNCEIGVIKEMDQTGLLVHIEFFQSNDSPYCETVRKMLLDILASDIGKNLLIEEVDINSEAGKTKAKSYQLKNVPSIAINGRMKFIGVPHPVLLFNEVKRIIREEQPKKPGPPKTQYVGSPKFPKKKDDEFSLYT